MSNVKETTPINFWEQMAPFWDMTEENGVNTEQAKIFSSFLVSPVLVLGSGQGLVSSTLIEQGFEVESVDLLPIMAEYALNRRDVKTQVGNALNYSSAKKFNSIVVSTGLVTQQLLETEQLPLLLENLKSLSFKNSTVVLSYFRLQAWRTAATELGLHKKPSKDYLFWQAKGDIQQAKELFKAEQDTDVELIEKHFLDYSDEFEKRAAFIYALGERYQAFYQQSPETFLGEIFGTANIELTEDSEKQLLTAIKQTSCEILETSSYQDNHVQVIVYR